LAIVHTPFRMRRLYWLMLGTWTVLGLIESSKWYFRGITVGWGMALLANMPWWYTWALITPVAFLLARRFRLDQPRRWAAVIVHLGAAVGFAVLHSVVVGTVFYYTISRGRVGLQQQIQGWLDSYLVVNMVTYLAIIGAWYAIHNYHRFQDRQVAAARAEARAARFESQAAEATLSALRMELNPHFLFNALNAVSGLVRRGDADAAVSMLARLGDLLRVTLRRDAANEIELQEEMALLQQYLEIEQIRFGDRLRIALDVPDDLQHVLVPTLILQPIVENAVRHGVASTSRPVQIEIAAHRDNGRVVLSVHDSGKGFPEPVSTLRPGLGLTNTDARLHELYHDRAALTVANDPAGGALVRIAIPLPAPPPDPLPPT